MFNVSLIFFRNPNGPSTDSRPDHTSPQPYWDSYDTINQLYLELGKLFI